MNLFGALDTWHDRNSEYICSLARDGLEVLINREKTVHKMGPYLAKQKKYVAL